MSVAVCANLPDVVNTPGFKTAPASLCSPGSDLARDIAWPPELGFEEPFAGSTTALTLFGVACGVMLSKLMRPSQPMPAMPESGVSNGPKDCAESKVKSGLTFTSEPVVVLSGKDQADELGVVAGG